MDLERFHEALILALDNIVERWWKDKEAGFPVRMPLASEAEELLRVSSPYINLPIYVKTIFRVRC